MQELAAQDGAEYLGLSTQQQFDLMAKAGWNEAGTREQAAVVNQLAEKYRIKIYPREIGGVPCYFLEPEHVLSKNRNRLLVHLHGGAYTGGGGSGASWEAIRVSAISQMRTVAIDYRMPPEFPYPAAIDDAMSVWRKLVQSNKSARLGVFGTSTGGAMTLLMVQRAKKERLPLPGAIFAGTPWADMSKTGDSYFTNAYVDNVTPTYEGGLQASALLYANGRDLKDPGLSPIYGDFTRFPPTLLVAGTRDLFLSNTVRVHVRLLESGTEAKLVVLEGQSHAQYLFSETAPESHFVINQVVNFMDRHLSR